MHCTPFDGFHSGYIIVFGETWVTCCAYNVVALLCIEIGKSKFCPYESIAYLRICICIRAIELYRNLDAISSGHMPLKAFFNKKIIIIEQLLNYGRISCAACLLLAKMKVKIPETNVNRNGNKDYLLHFLIYYRLVCLRLYYGI